MFRGGARSQTSSSVGFDDSFPLNLIEYLRSIPSSTDDTLFDQPTSSQRPAKRQKTDAAECPSIHVANCDVSFSRKCLDSSDDFSISRLDIDQYVELDIPNHQFHYRNRTKPPSALYHLLISSPTGAPLGNLRVDVSLRQNDITQGGSYIIATSNRKNSKPGSFWTTSKLTIQRQGWMIFCKFSVELHWNETLSPYLALRGSVERWASQNLIDELFPLPYRQSSKDDSDRSSAWSPLIFYESAFVPPKSDEIADSIEVPGLEATLFPYQKRTMRWLLGREGVEWSKDARQIKAFEREQSISNTGTFRLVKDASGKDFYLSDVFHVVTRDPRPFLQAESVVKGGILAEEMGLGKTLEILGLTLLHPRPTPLTLTTHEAEANLTPTGATLIVAPESLRTQWMSEISRHAPGLNVMYYPGRKKFSDVTRRKKFSDISEEDLVNELAACDVVITTYAILSAEVHYATAPPERSRRHARAYPRANSPLVQMSWWRVCLDEAQMVENGYSQAAIVARVIPRVNAWGITGTPVKDDVKDLSGLLLFLRYEPFCSSTPVWQSLITEHKPIFQKLFKSISLRHTKTMVRDELLLPPQKRYVITMPFTAVEEQHYQSLYQEMASECSLSVDGAPLVDDWDPEDHEETMRRWLNRLRQTALHPEVAVYNRRALGHSKSRPMRTVDEVLDAMLEQSEMTIRTDERTYFSTKLTRGQLYENSPRVREALEIWQAVREEAEKLVSEARKELNNLVGQQAGQVEKGRDSNDTEDSEDSEDEAEKGESKERLGECRRRLRDTLQMYHKAVFFCANAHFQIRDNPEMTEPDSQEFKDLKKLEDEGYEQAKVIRREILHESHKKATRLMDKVAKKTLGQSFVEVAELSASSEKGIESSAIIEGLEDLYGELNEQANIIDEWREHVIQLLLKPLVDEDDEVETTGEELADSAKIQDELMAYVTALRAAIADRQDAITGQKNELIKYETETATKLAKEGNGPAPEQMIQLLQIRAEVKPAQEHCSMRGALSNLRSLISKLDKDVATGSHRAKMESSIAQKHLKETHRLLNEQSKANVALEAEIESFKTTMNSRLEYYRQLQVVSDSVLPYEGPKTALAIDRMLQQEEKLRKKIGAAEAKHRYLLHLKEAGNKSNEPRMCVICQSPFSIGVLTVCGHQFCKECMMMWFKAHHNCPVCKKTLKTSNLHDITINPQQLKVHNEGIEETQPEGEQSPQQRRNFSPKKTVIYSEFNSDKLTEIQKIQLDGPSFTTKVDTLVKHLLWLRESDPGAKSIVFSQYKDFLSILRNAFKRFRIGYAAIDDQGGITRFKEDPSIECFLLHARAHSSGLNLVNANHVFLCEPLLNTALELQAIARVDRIGQQHETTVWLYLVSGTVEESIYNLSVQRRMEHMGRNIKGKSKESTPELLDASIEAANTLELEQAALSKLMSKDKTAGEMVDKNDLWECLFGHVARKEAEPERDNRLQEQAVMGYLAAEAAEERRAEQGGTPLTTDSV